MTAYTTMMQALPRRVLDRSAAPPAKGPPSRAVSATRTPAAPPPGEHVAHLDYPNLQPVKLLGVIKRHDPTVPCWTKVLLTFTGDHVHRQVSNHLLTRQISGLAVRSAPSAEPSTPSATLAVRHTSMLLARPALTPSQYGNITQQPPLTQYTWCCA